MLANIHDAQVVRVPLTDNWQLPADFATSLNAAGVELTCAVNPHAPSGTLSPVQTLAEIAATLNGVLLVDEAYANFIDPDREYDSASLVEQFDNVLILRTFSKGYSLAGLRLGYLLGAETLIDPILSKTRDSYNIDHISQALGLAAINDQPYAQQTWAKVREERQRLANNLGQLGLKTQSSQANFLLAEVPSSAAMTAHALYLHLKQQHILVRYFDAPRLDDKLRISIGTPQLNDQLMALLTEVLT